MFDKVKYHGWKGLNGAHDDSYEHLRLPYEKVSGEERVLFVLDSVPGEDLKKDNDKLLSGDVGSILRMLVMRAAAQTSSHFSWMAMTYNACRTIGKSKEFISSAQDEFRSRLTRMVRTYKPTKIVVFGQDPFFALSTKAYDLTKGNFCVWLGVPCRVKFEHGIVPVTGCQSLRYVADGSAASAGLLGYMVRTLVNGLTGQLKYRVDTDRIKAHKTRYIKTIKGFDALMDMLEKHEGPVSVDTETKNLNRICNAIQTIQFAITTDVGYVVPLLHKDSPFTGEELKHVFKRLRLYFEGRNNNEYHIHANAQFDLNVMRGQFKIRYYANSLWDIFGAEFCFDPSTLVMTDKGKVAIRDIVADPDSYLIYSYNFETQEIELKPVTNAHSIRTEKRMVDLEYEGGSLRVTEDHEVWSVTRNEYVEVRHLLPEEEILVSV